MGECKTCELVERRDRGEAPAWDAILRSRSWDVAHCYGTSVEGWLVLACRRHVTSIAELTDTEAAELGPLLKLVSTALRDAMGCAKTYVAQFAEHPRHPHVHVHVVPRRADHPDALKGPRIFDALGVSDEDAVPPERMTEIAASLGPFLTGAHVSST